MKRLGLTLMFAALIASMAGCPSLRPRLWQPPGPIPYQQYNATVHDPYVDQDLGPQVVGGRPREFQAPRAEPVRNRQLQDRWP